MALRVFRINRINIFLDPIWLVLVTPFSPISTMTRPPPLRVFTFFVNVLHSPCRLIIVIIGLLYKSICSRYVAVTSVPIFFFFSFFFPIFFCLFFLFFFFPFFFFCS